MTAVPGRQHYNLTLAILTMAGTAFALQQTMVFPALTTFQHEFDTTAAWATWVLTAFLLTASVATPLLGKLGDQHGKERMLVIALSIFLLGTIGGAFAWDIGSLIFFRAVAGAGGAVFPLSFGIIRDEFPPEKVKVGIGLLSAVFGVGGGLGIVLSGLIVDNLSWRWLFVVGAIPGRGLDRARPPLRAGVADQDARAARRARRGAPRCGPRLAAHRAHGGRSLGLDVTVLPVPRSLTSGLLLLAWIWTELRVEEPMVDMRMMSQRPVLLTNTTALIAGFAMLSYFRARAAVREHAGVVRLRLRRVGNGRRSLPPALVAR